MRRLLPALLLFIALIAAKPATAAWTHVQGNRTGDASDPATVSTLVTGFTVQALTNPSVIVVTTGYGTPVDRVSSITDTAGNTFTKITSGADAPNTQAMEIWWAPNTHTTSSDQITIHYTAAVGFAWMLIDEFTGGGTSPSVDASNKYVIAGSHASPGPYSGNSLTPSADGALVYGAWVEDSTSSNSNAISANNGFTIGTANNGPGTGQWASEWQSQSTAAASTASFSWTNTGTIDYVIGSVVILPTPAAPHKVVHRVTQQE